MDEKNKLSPDELKWTKENKELDKELENVRRDEIESLERQIRETSAGGFIRFLSGNHPSEIPSYEEAEEMAESWRKICRERIERLKTATPDTLRALKERKDKEKEVARKSHEQKSTGGQTEVRHRKLNELSDSELQERIWKWQSELEKSERAGLEYEADQEREILSGLMAEAKRRGLNMEG